MSHKRSQSADLATEISETTLTSLRVLKISVKATLDGTVYLRSIAKASR